MSTDRIAALIRAAQLVTDTYQQDLNVRAADMAGLAAALAEVVSPASAVADLSEYTVALADAGIDPLHNLIGAIRHLRHVAQMAESLTAAKNIVFEMNVRAVVAYIDETSETAVADIAAGLGVNASQAFLAEGRERALIGRAIGR